MFIGAALYSYLRSLTEWRTFFASFLILLFYAYSVTTYLSQASLTNGVAGGSFAPLASIVFGALFFLLIGIKEFVFLHRAAIFNFLSGALYFFIGTTFFVVDRDNATPFFAYFIITFIALHALIRESVDFFMEDAPRSKKRLLVAGSAVLIMEFLSIITLLPIGFLSSAALIILMVFVLEDLVYYHLRGMLNRQIIINNVAILALSIILIFATSKLSL